MKALTIYQPWASLLACGAKKYETRSWATNYRGPIAIHAGAKYINDFYENFASAAHAELKNAMQGFAFMHSLPRGAVIATAELVDCYEMLRPKGRGASFNDRFGINNTGKEIYPTEREMLFGDWTPGRYAWEFANMTLLPEPIPARGKQRFWEWEAFEIFKPI